jgi:hypothetical protein
LETKILWFLKYFRRKIWQKYWLFCSNYCLFLQKIDHNIGFWEKRQFFAENWGKSQKIVIITSAHDIVYWYIKLYIFFAQSSNFLPNRRNVLIVKSIPKQLLSDLPFRYVFIEIIFRR